MPISNNFFEAILFDMDGTLVNTEPLWLASETDLMARYGYPWSERDQANCLGGPLDRVGEYMFARAGDHESPEFFTNTLISLVGERLRGGVGLMEGAEDLLDLCREHAIPVALVSASPRVLVDAVLASFDNRHFDVSISSDDVTRVKPDPQGYHIAAERLAVRIERSLILEDSATGVAAAKASGARVVAIPHLVAIPEDDQVKVIHSVRELSLETLVHLFQRWNNVPQTQL
jgi:HAD superfamily hydrolase (TIGR01509 family)